MMATYVLGVLGIAALLLPDWDYFNRDFSRWPYPVTAEERANSSIHAQGSGFLRCPLFTLSPIHVIYYPIYISLPLGMILIYHLTAKEFNLFIYFSFERIYSIMLGVLLFLVIRLVSHSP